MDPAGTVVRAGAARVERTRARWRGQEHPCAAPGDRPRIIYRASTAKRRPIISPTETPAWISWALLSACFAAGTAIFAKIGLEGVDADLATLVRTAIIVVVLAGFVAYAGKWSNPLALPLRTWFFLGLSALATGASWVCYFRALQAGPAHRVAPIDKLSVVLVALFAVAFLGERPGAREWTGIALVGAGVLLLALKR